MGKAVIGMIEELVGQVEAHAGQQVARLVAQEVESLTPRSKDHEVARSVRAAVERLDRELPRAVRERIMAACGQNCSRRNRTVLERAKARRAGFVSEEEFLAAELREPPAGTRLERDGYALYQVYTPQSYTRPMRCYCALMRGLPEGETISPTYCLCSRAFVQAMWEELLGRSVKVDLLSSAVSGSAECRFKIAL